MTTPNIFDFAKSELSQDATLGYILAWADPQYRQNNPSLNELGENLLRALVTAAAGEKDVSNPLQAVAIEKVKVGTQRDRIDVWTEINDSVFLIIEDKIDTEEHHEQIKKSIGKAAGYHNSDDALWPEILAVYVKTGNESTKRRSKSAPCGIFLRDDLLEVLSKTPGTGNTIVEEFRRHLQGWSIATASFRETAWQHWTWMAIQGYYLALGQWLSGEAGSDEDWGYVPNAEGGFLGFWWHFREFETQQCRLYLQIEDGVRLTIRVGDARNDIGDDIKVGKDLLWRLFYALEDVAMENRFKRIHVPKAGRFRGGWSANVVDLRFDNDDETYLATDQDNVLDWSATQQRLSLAMEFVVAVCAKPAIVEATS